jgi:hypothetical protein
VGAAARLLGPVADGPTFASLGHRRTREGRAVSAAHRAELVAAEARVNAKVDVLESGGAEPGAGGVRADRRAVGPAVRGGVPKLTWPLPGRPLLAAATRRRGGDRRGWPGASGPEVGVV